MHCMFPEVSENERKVNNEPSEFLDVQNDLIEECQQSTSLMDLGM